jgi:SAM-dependent methyltransferase
VSEVYGPIVITADAYPYLQMQRGAISDMRDDPVLWCNLYVESIHEEFRRIEPYLPQDCDAILDIGSGLGGIDIMLQRHYGESCEITLLDGFDDAAIVQSHAKTFSHMGVAREFLSANGVTRVHCLDANSSDPLLAPSFFDLVVSFRSWCFHVEPDRYVDFVHRNSLGDGFTKIIVDMRNRHREPMRHGDWWRQMSAVFNHVDMIHSGGKGETHIWETR